MYVSSVVSASTVTGLPYILLTSTGMVRAKGVIVLLFGYATKAKIGGHILPYVSLAINVRPLKLYTCLIHKICILKKIITFELD